MLEETAAHEAAAVAEAVSAERMHCVVKLASFLQVSSAMQQLADAWLSGANSAAIDGL